MAQKIVIEDRDFAFQNRLHTFSIVNKGYKELSEYFANGVEYFVNKVSNSIQEHAIIKLGACFVADFSKNVFDENGEMHQENQKLYMHTATLLIDQETNLHEHFNENIVSFINNRIEDIQLRGSGFSLAEIIELNIQISKHSPIAGSSYIALPPHLSNKKAIVNVQNKDQMCFKYAILSALYPVEIHGNRVSKYKPYENVLNFTGIQFPVKLKSITKFEQQNENISINVYMYDVENKVVQPLRLSKEVKLQHIHLLLLTRDDGGSGEINMHYCWIKDLSALLSKQISKNGHKVLFCDRCMNHFPKKEMLDKHFENCKNQNDCQVEMPTLDANKIHFEKVEYKLKVPFIIYADLESLLMEPNQKFCSSEMTKAFQQHQAYSIGLYFKSEYDDSQSYYKSFCGVDCIDDFVQELRHIANHVENILNKVKPLKMTEADEKRFRDADHCHICEEKFTAGDVRVRDHSHITGEFRGSAHNQCNLRYQESRHVPVVFHNLSRYDAHFIIEKISTCCKGGISAIPLNDELYISFTQIFPSSKVDFPKFIKLRFIDSFRFMPSSLDYLASLIPSEKKKILHNNFQNLSLDNIRLLERKGIFCYDYMDSWSKLNETQLPTKDEFYSKLTESHISDKDYEHAVNVWDAFNIKTLSEYSDLYMKTDILLLADVFQNFRDTCQDIYGLDPAHYFTAPGLSFDAMLKFTKVKIELLTDVDMLLFAERGIRGGISQCSKRYVKANNKYIANYDPDVESNFLMYLDANNLYGHAMSQYLPLSSFSWSTAEFNAASISQIPDNSCVGYIFEVDLEYPKHLHDKHKDYPLCPDRLKVPGKKDEAKLLLTLYDKEHYVIHYSMLKIVLQQGIRLKKVHRVLQFRQSQWLKPYIDLNTRMRMQSKNDFEKNFYKLMNNAIFGKTMENVRARADIKFKNKWDGAFGAAKLISKPNFKRWTAFKNDLVAIHLTKTKVVMNKPIIVGMVILDISKVLMYDYYYNCLQPQYGDKVEMVYTDTDSFILNVKTDCFYADIC